MTSRTSFADAIFAAGASGDDACCAHISASSGLPARKRRKWRRLSEIDVMGFIVQLQVLRGSGDRRFGIESECELYYVVHRTVKRPSAGVFHIPAKEPSESLIGTIGKIALTNNNCIYLVREWEKPWTFGQRIDPKRAPPSALSVARVSTRLLRARLAFAMIFNRLESSKSLSSFIRLRDAARWHRPSS